MENDLEKILEYADLMKVSDKKKQIKKFYEFALAKNRKRCYDLAVEYVYYLSQDEQIGLMPTKIPIKEQKK